MVDPNPCSIHVLGHPLLHPPHTPIKCHIHHRYEKLQSMVPPLATCCCRCTTGPKVQHLAAHLIMWPEKSTTHQVISKVQHLKAHKFAHGPSACLHKLREVRQRLESILHMDNASMFNKEKHIQREKRVGVVWIPTNSGEQRLRGKLHPNWGLQLLNQL